MGLGGPNSSGRSINRSVARLMGPDPLLGCEPRTLPLFDEASELCVFFAVFWPLSREGDRFLPLPRLGS